LPCTRHPLAPSHRDYCAACLLEEALISPDTVATTSIEAMRQNHQEGARHFTIQMPLGESASASVFLVKGEYPDLQFLRLKMWRRPAAPGFLARFQQLQKQLEGWDCDAIVPPLAASIDATGCPSVLSGFRQGVPIVDRVKSGRLDPEDACARLTPLVELTHRAHARGLVHGSIVPGNVIIPPDSAAACLLDFGLAPLFALPGTEAAFASGDLAGFDALARTLRELPASSAPLPRL
jgi:serine/threonine protein kinase